MKKIISIVLFLSLSVAGYTQYTIKVDTAKIPTFNDTLSNGGKIATKYDLTQTSGGVGVWEAITAAYASGTTATMTGTQKTADMMVGSLVTYLNEGGEGRYGHIEKAVYAGGTITLTIYSSVALVSGDHAFYYAPNLKDRSFERRVTIPGECIADASYPQGMWYQGNASDTLIVFDFSAWVLTAASGAGASCVFNVYHGSTNIFTSGVDLTTATSSLHNYANTYKIPPSTNVSLRITASAGATNKASDFQLKYFAVPSRYFFAK